MKIGIGCDHAAFLEKEKLIKYIENEFNYEVIDFGTKSEDSVDYAEFGHAVGNVIKNRKVNRGIVICGSGIANFIAGSPIKKTNLLWSDPEIEGSIFVNLKASAIDTYVSDSRENK